MVGGRAGSLGRRRAGGADGAVVAQQLDALEVVVGDAVALRRHQVALVAEEAVDGRRGRQRGVVLQEELLDPREVLRAMRERVGMGR